jgi:hypothetical protein
MPKDVKSVYKVCYYASDGFGRSETTSKSVLVIAESFAEAEDLFWDNKPTKAETVWWVGCEGRVHAGKV